MKIGGVMFFTTDSMQPAPLAKALEERGFESLWVPEHTHIPSSRKTEYPAGGPLIRLWLRDPTFEVPVALLAALVGWTLVQAVGGVWGTLMNGLSHVRFQAVCAVVTALFLYQFGTGPVRGFAVTLIVGTLASMVTAIFVTRTFYLLWLARRSPTAPLSI